MAPRVHDQEYDLDHHGDSFYIRVNDTGRNFRLVKTPVAAPGRESWKEVVPHRPDVMLEGTDFFQDFYVLSEREHGLPAVPRHELRDRRHAATSSSRSRPTRRSPAATPSSTTTQFRYRYQSLVTPASTFDYDVETRASKLLKEQPVLGGYDRTQYVSERLFATAPDGVKVPLSIVYRKDLKRDGRAPLYLYGYGSYGLPLPVNFSSNRLSLLDRGVTFAIAHIRGGGDLGKAWHDDGRMMKKKNTFTDFIACAEYLHAGKYSSPDRTGHRGRQRGRPADGRRREPAARPLPGGRLQGPVRGRRQHHARRDAAADRRRVRGVGQPQEEGRVRVHQVLLPLLEPARSRPTRRCWSRRRSTTAR